MSGDSGKWELFQPLFADDTTLVADTEASEYWVSMLGRDGDSRDRAHWKILIRIWGEPTVDPRICITFIFAWMFVVCLIDEFGLFWGK